MKIELRNVKHAEFASHETQCFDASVYIDGKRAGTASNEGCGGPTEIFPPALRERLEAHAKTLPPTKYTYTLPGEEGVRENSLEQNAETVIDRLLAEWLVRRDMKRSLARKIVFTKADGRLYETNAMPAEKLRGVLARGEQYVRGKIEGVVKILNLLPEEEAYAIYRANDSA